MSKVIVPRKYAHRLKDSLWWWLGKERPFFINDEYKVELLFIDKDNLSAKIRVTNLKNGRSDEQDLKEASSQ